MQNKVLSMLGIAAKAGKIVSGEFSTEKAVKSSQAYLVLIAEDASANTKKKFTNMTDFYQVPCAVYGTREALGRSIGKEFRATLAVTDESLSRAVEKHLLSNQTE